MGLVVGLDIDVGFGVGLVVVDKDVVFVYGIRFRLHVAFSPQFNVIEFRYCS